MALNDSNESILTWNILRNWVRIENIYNTNVRKMISHIDLSCFVFCFAFPLGSGLDGGRKGGRKEGKKWEGVRGE